MNRNNIIVLRDALFNVLSDSEIAVIVSAIDNQNLALSDIFEGVDSFDELKTIDFSDGANEDIINTDIITYNRNNPNFLADNACDYVCINDGITKSCYIVTDNINEAEAATENLIIDFGKAGNLDEFDVDILDFIEDVNYFIDWYIPILQEEANDLLDSGELESYLVQLDYLNDYDYNDDGDLIRTNDELIDIYVDNKIDEISDKELIELFIEKEGEDTLYAYLGEEIDIDWNKLAMYCIDEDGIARYLSIDNNISEIEINGDTYYVFLYRQTNRI
jgi:hypothetical protein